MYINQLTASLLVSIRQLTLMDKLNAAFVDCVFCLMGSMWTANSYSVDSTPSSSLLKTSMYRLVVIMGCCWVWMVMVPPLLMYACMTMVVVSCSTSLLVVANSHLASSAESSDLDNCEEELQTNNMSTTLDAISTLPTLNFSSPTPSSSTTIDSCCICITRYSDGVKLRQLKCSHTFHVECVDKWLLLNPTCPLCKRHIRPSKYKGI